MWIVATMLDSIGYTLKLGHLGLKSSTNFISLTLDKFLDHSVPPLSHL